MEVVFDSAVTVPFVAVTAAEVVRDVCAVSVTFSGAERAAEMFRVDAVEVIAILPAVEVREAPELVIAAEPDKMISPEARMAPVGSTLVPPLIVTVPAEAVSAPEPA